MGYSSQSKGYKLWDPEKRTMVVSRDVTFLEEAHYSTDPASIDIEEDDDMNQGGVPKVQFNVPSSSETQPPINSGSDSEDEDLDEEETPKSLRRSFRKFRKPIRFTPSMPAIALAAEGSSDELVPNSYKAATTEENIRFWKPGIDREHDCLLRNKTWTIVDRKPRMHVLPCKYVFRIKNGGPKARMVILGCKQIYGLDYYQTLAPVVKFTTIRTLLAIAATEDFEYEQMDVVTAFLNGDLNEEIFMHIRFTISEE